MMRTAFSVELICLPEEVLMSVPGAGYAEDKDGSTPLIAVY